MDEIMVHYCRWLTGSAWTAREHVPGYSTSAHMFV